MALVVPTLLVVNQLSAADRYQICEVNPKTLNLLLCLLSNDLDKLIEKETALELFLKESATWRKEVKSVEDLRSKLRSSEQYNWDGDYRDETFLMVFNQQLVEEKCEVMYTEFNGQFVRAVLNRIPEIRTELNNLQTETEKLLTQSEILQDVLKFWRSCGSREKFLKKMRKHNLEFPELNE